MRLQRQIETPGSDIHSYIHSDISDFHSQHPFPTSIHDIRFQHPVPTSVPDSHPRHPFPTSVLTAVPDIRSDIRSRYTFRTGVQNSWKCLAAKILCLAKCVNRDIVPTCVKARKSRHFAHMPQSAYIATFCQDASKRTDQDTSAK